MRIFDLLSILNPNIRAEDTKVHLATWNGEDEPINVYLAGKFDEWQRWQTKKNFEREIVVSLIKYGPDTWLFGGTYYSGHVNWLEDQKLYYYELSGDPKCEELNGRVIASFRRPGRQSYLNAEKWIDSIEVKEIFAEEVSIGEFPGYNAVNLTKDELNLVVRQSLDSWRTALSNVAGVYLISDTQSGRLYVGSAVGEGGIWERWTSYAADGHGGNIELRKLLETEGLQRARHFRFSILEIAGLHASSEEIRRKESHWKDILMTRTYGLNKN